MIAADTSTWIALLQGDSGRDVDALTNALAGARLLMPPPVLTELLSASSVPAEVSAALRRVPLIDIEPGYWERAGSLRARAIRRKRKARLADALIAQSCIDNQIPLITRARDFHAFAEEEGLKLIIAFEH
jgi:predicted nucleic acid-binding protein